MNRKKLINRMQNLTLLLLTVSALFLISRFPMLTAGWNARFQAILTADHDSGQESSYTETSPVISSVHLVVTADIEYGRYSQLFASTADPSFSAITPLFREALGSASVLGATADLTLQEALRSPSLYLGLPSCLPMEVVALWLGDTADFTRNVRAVALTTEEADAAMLYLCGEDGSISRFETALPVSAVREAAQAFSPNGGSFAFESNYGPLAPYTVLVSELDPVPCVCSGLPDGYSAYNLLTALGFNPHTNFRYTESNGTEVVEESPRTLRIGPDGAVTYSGGEGTAAALFRVSSAGEIPTAAEALGGARRLAAALAEGTGGGALALEAAEAADNGWTVTFRYQAEGLPVLLADGEPALSVTIEDGAITAFTYVCRVYAAADQTSALLPPSMATAIASLRSGAGLSLGYVDGGAEMLEACWLAQ